MSELRPLAAGFHWVKQKLGSKQEVGLPSFEPERVSYLAFARECLSIALSSINLCELSGHNTNNFAGLCEKLGVGRV